MVLDEGKGKDFTTNDYQFNVVYSLLFFKENVTIRQLLV